MIADFNNREIYVLGQICDPKDTENFVQIRMYLFYFNYGDFLCVQKYFTTSCTYDYMNNLIFQSSLMPRVFH